ncbi:MAG TPA: hypothetical protein VMU61_14870 [Candidatus Aquilonibacter sp.]|nr:hypothetical protein [Candidatus Aquilonibacter sp.]
MRSQTTFWTLLLVLFVWFPGAAKSQTERPPMPRTDITVASPDDGDARDRMIRDMAKKANQERAAALKADTDRLLKLATELKASVDKSNENVLSVDVIKKAEEIEKLAKSVKDKMRGPN